MARFKKRIVYGPNAIAEGYPITVTQTGVDAFTVTYGLQVRKGLTYADAARELGECIFHAAACAGKLDNA